MGTFCELSIIVPARNEGPALSETLKHLQSILSPGSYEIVVIDDCSDPPLIDQIESSIPVVYHRSVARQGVARSRNIGASLAKGQTFFFIDAHVCFNEAVRSMIAQQSTTDFGKIKGCRTRIIRDFQQYSDIARKQIIAPEVADEEYYGWKLELSPHPDVVVNRVKKSDDPFLVPYVAACALLISRSLFLQLGGFDDGLIGYGSLEDAELGMRCWVFGNEVELVPNAICYHYSKPIPPSRVHPNAPNLPIDHPRYDGAFVNALRVAHLHFPPTIIACLANEIDRLSLESGTVKINSQFSPVGLQERGAWLEARRVRSREWLIQRLTYV